MNKFSLPTF